MPQSTRELTAAISSGDAEAFARFYSLWFDQTYAWARQATRRDESFCLDIVQDTMLKVIRRIKPIETPEALGAWLRRVVQTTAYDALRAESRRRAREQRRSTTPHVVIDAQRTDAEQLAWLRAQLASLDDDAARLLEARHRFGRTLASIAREFGLSPGAADRRLARIAERLRRKASRFSGDTPDEH